MASLLKVSGRFVLQFQTPDARRRTLRLGKIPKRDAESAKCHVEAILSAALSGHSMPDDTARWIGRLGDAFHDKLAAVGLVTARERATLAAFIDGYVQGRAATLKPRTLVVWRHVRRNLIEFFGKDKALRDITPGAADQWRLWLTTQEKLNVNTVSKRCQVASMFFRAALRHRLIAENPFQDVKAKGQSNPTRAHFISRDVAAKVLEACPDHEWRLIFALSRFGGLRCPSEHLALTWSDVDWERNRLRVSSCKTEHHEGKAERWIPLFPELREHLAAAFEAAEPGAINIITRYRDTNSNLRTQFQRIIRRAGLSPWPKLFHNLRATRETELAETFPLHVVCDWIGNSQRIAARHYLQVTDDHFARAAEGENESEKALQNPTYGLLEMGGNASQPVLANVEKPSKNPAFPENPHFVTPPKVAEGGLEPPTHGL